VQSLLYFDVKTSAETSLIAAADCLTCSDILSSAGHVAVAENGGTQLAVAAEADYSRSHCQLDGFAAAVVAVAADC